MEHLNNGFRTTRPFTLIYTHTYVFTYILYLYRYTYVRIRYTVCVRFNRVCVILYNV